MGATVQRVTNGTEPVATVASVLEVLEADGAVIVEGLIDPGVVGGGRGRGRRRTSPRPTPRCAT